MNKIRKEIEIFQRKHGKGICISKRIEKQILEEITIDIARNFKKLYHIKFDICSRCLREHDVVVLERGDFCPDCLQKIIKDLEDENRKLKGGFTKN